jgi:hypothetical protein
MPRLSLQNHPQQEHQPGRFHLLLEPHHPPAGRGRAEPPADGRAHGDDTRGAHLRRPGVPGQDLRREHHARGRGHGGRAARVLPLGADRQDPNPAGRGDGEAEAVL